MLTERWTQHGRMVGNLARRHSRYEDVRPSKERVMPRQRSGTQIVWQGRFRKHLMHCYKGGADRLRILEAAISSTQARRRYLEGIYTQSPHNHYSCIFRRPAREKHLVLQWFVSIILTNYWKTSIPYQFPDFTNSPHCYNAIGGHILGRTHRLLDAMSLDLALVAGTTIAYNQRAYMICTSQLAAIRSWKMVCIHHCQSKVLGLCSIRSFDAGSSCVFVRIVRDAIKVNSHTTCSDAGPPSIYSYDAPLCYICCSPLLRNIYLFACSFARS